MSIIQMISKNHKKYNIYYILNDNTKDTTLFMISLDQTFLFLPMNDIIIDIAMKSSKRS